MERKNPVTIFDRNKNITSKVNRNAFWREFKEKYPQYKEIPTKDLNKICDGIFDKSAQLLTETEHGIILNGIGYFANTVYHSNLISNQPDGNTWENFHTKGDIYRSMLFADVFFANPLKTFRFRLLRRWKRHIAKMVKKGLRYKNHYMLIKKNKGKVFKNFFGKR